MDERDHIGEWIVRVRGDETGPAMTKDHRVESRVGDRFVTHCGREFGPIEGTTLVFDVPIPDDRCSRC